MCYAGGNGTLGINDMATKNWNGASAAFNTDADWSPTGTPGFGDIAIINAGTVTATGTLAPALAIQLNAASTSPTLALTAVTIQAGDSITVNGQSSTATLSVAGATVNAGNITLTGASPSLNLNSAAGTTLTNQGGISITGTGGFVQSFGAGQIVNNGIISLRAAQNATQTDTVFGEIAGAGQIRLMGSVTLNSFGAIGTGQTVVFENGAAKVALSAPNAFNARFSGFSSNDDITASGLRWSTVSYDTAGQNAGTLNFRLADGSITYALAFAGNYDPQSSFSITQSAGTGTSSTTDIRTTAAEAPVRINIIDQTTGVTSTDPGTVYTGPVSYLQYQYLYFGSDDVVLGANVNNVFLHGGAGNDAIQVKGGSNVIDGGGGSNFLVGATGADGGNDTFFIDETSNIETWSTLVNFHVGDTATIFGFKAGISTLPITAVDGAGGYQGVTIHSEIRGAGTGITGSVTFTGLTVADFNRFTLSTGRTPDNQDYLLIQRFS